MRTAFAVLALVAVSVAQGFELPPVCAEYPAEPDLVTPIAELRAQVEKAFEIDPSIVVATICATIPRVEREHGIDSEEIAWWVGSLATPLIAYLDRHDEAVPLLEFALPLYQRHLGPYAAEVSDVHVAYAWMNFRRGLLRESGEAWERALAVREHNPGIKKIELQKVLVGLAQVRLTQRNFQAARDALDRASAILAENDEYVSEAAAAIENAYTNIALREENYALARSHAERQLDIERQLLHTSAQLVSANVSYAQILEQLDEFEAAEAALREAIALAESDDHAPLQRHHLTALTQLADSLTRRGKPQEAIGFANRAVEVGLATLGASAPRMVRVYDTRAETLHALGEWSAAFADYSSADAIIGEHAADMERPVLVSHYRGKGLLYAVVGDSRAARDAFQAALDASESDASLSTERAQTLLAISHLNRFFSRNRQRDYLLLAQSLLSQKLPDSHPDILRVVNELCAMELESTEAPACADALLRLESARSVDPALATRVLTNLSRKRAASGEADAAFELAVQALAYAGGLGTPDPQWRALFQVAELLAARNNTFLAVFFGKQAIVEIERQRGYFAKRDYEFERGFIADKTNVYRTVADWLFGLQRIDEGIQVLGLLKVEELHDFLLRASTNIGDTPVVSLSAQEQALLDSYRNLFRSSGDNAGQEIDRLRQLRQADSISVSEDDNLNKMIAVHSRWARRQAAQLRNWLASASTAPAASDSIPRSSAPRSHALETLRRRFGSGTALATYLLTDDRLRIIVATDDGLSEHSVPVSAPALRREIGSFLNDIGARGEMLAGANSLYRTLLEPVTQAAAASAAHRLVLWPDDALRYLPFAALHDGDAYVGQKYAVQIFSGSQDEHVPAAFRESAIRGLGTTASVGEFRPLPAMAEELCSIIDGPILGLNGNAPQCSDEGIGRGVVKGEGYVDALFTAARLNAVLQDRDAFGFLHLGTHFRLHPGNALRSSLLLGDGSTLSLSDIARLDFRGLEMVALSACQTGLGGTASDDGREIEGLSSVVLRRGARRVVASLWLVEDTSTARLMQYFYRALNDSGGDAALAMQQASAAVRATEQYRHPFYWAGFFVAGDGP